MIIFLQINNKSNVNEKKFNINNFKKILLNK